MIDGDTWQIFGGLLGVLIALGGAALALQRLGILRPSRPAPPKGGEGDLPGQVADLQRRVATLEERTRKHEGSLAGIGRVHQRIDGLAESTSRIEGEVTQMNRTLQVMLRHMMGDRE